MSDDTGLKPFEGRTLDDLRREWEAKYVLQPKLPTSALLTGALAMALGFGTVMFFAFAWVTHFRRPYVIGTVIFLTLSLSVGVTNRILARRWFSKVREWSRERELLAQAMKQRESGASDGP